MSLLEAIAAVIAEHLDGGFTLGSQQAIGGGCISSAFKLRGSSGEFFVKVNDASKAEMFAAEADGLRELASARAIRVPEVICHGEAQGQAFLVLEVLQLVGDNDQRELGRQIAALHQHRASQYGWYRDNTIGATPQKNTRSSDWVSFYRDQRLLFQFELAKRHGYRGRLFDRADTLLADIGAFFKGHAPAPSLLHGDLWSGNYAFHHGQPVIFDPAVYYGDAEADIAMTELFGGFSDDFYSTYRELCPFDDGYTVRRTLYNLYHVVNHLNLFGGGYQGQAEGMVDRLLAEIHS